MSDWIEHDSTKSPVLAPMALVEICLNPDKTMRVCDFYGWFTGLRYRQVYDRDGVPYCSAEGLEPWAEYVATDGTGGVKQTDVRLFRGRYKWKSSMFEKHHGTAPDTHRHPGDWRASMMRVWRQDEG